MELAHASLYASMPVGSDGLGKAAAPLGTTQLAREREGGAMYADGHPGPTHPEPATPVITVTQENAERAHKIAVASVAAVQALLISLTAAQTLRLPAPDTLGAEDPSYNTTRTMLERLGDWAINVGDAAEQAASRLISPVTAWSLREVGGMPDGRTVPTAAPVARCLRAMSAWELPADAQAAAAARRLTQATLRVGGVADHVIEDAVLVVSELVANAVRHGRPPIRLRVWRDGAACIQIAVSDTGLALPSPHATLADELNEHGWGLRVVAALAAWQVNPVPNERGKTVVARLTTAGRR